MPVGGRDGGVVHHADPGAAANPYARSRMPAGGGDRTSLGYSSAIGSPGSFVGEGVARGSPIPSVSTPYSSSLSVLVRKIFGTLAMLVSIQ